MGVANRGARTHTPSYVCMNNRQGAFPQCAPLRTESATIILAADFDGDGHVDIYVPHRDGGRSRVFWGDGSGDFSSVPNMMLFGPPSTHIRAAATGDVDGDGMQDIVAGDETGGVFFYKNIRGRGFAEPVRIDSAHSGAPYSLALGDMNKDGAVDVVIGRQDAAGSVLFNAHTHTQGGKLSFTEVVWGDGAGSVYGVAVGDMDGDGWLDIAAARSDAPNGVWFSNAHTRVSDTLTGGVTDVPATASLRGVGDAGEVLM
eukprot:GDKI01017770.1.p1 GENE.GDKI01017770.1~~GDKI01017770.1.p1  ORF type:complete len:258 (+),score=98.68 GDKI01017770.1:1-774(+)